MADNSKRERIAVALEEAMQRITSVKTVQRTWPSLSSMANFGEGQFPVVAVVVGLPDPFEFKRSGRTPGGVDVFRSNLATSIYVYDRIDDEHADTRLSQVVDDVWAALWADPTLGGLVDEMSAGFPEPPETVDPYLACRLSIGLRYRHTTEGI